MSRTPEDFQAELLGLMPPGSAISKDPESVNGRLMLAIGDGLSEIDALTELLVEEADPRKTMQLLPDWEAAVGLPDPCAGPAPTIQARRAQLIARLTAEGGQSIDILEAYMAALGYQVTIQNFHPFTPGISAVGDPRSPVCDTSWRFVFQVNAPLNTVTYFTPGVSAFPEPLASWGNAVLECEMRRIAPAHTMPIFIYS
jgi:uncharacterized protein YmfQ (DUF2313 family)